MYLRLSRASKKCNQENGVTNKIQGKTSKVNMYLMMLDAVTAAEDNMQSKLSRKAIKSQGQRPNKDTGKDYKSQYVSI